MTEKAQQLPPPEADSRLIAAAVDVHAAAAALGEAYAELQETLKLYRRAAWDVAGDLGQSDVGTLTNGTLAAEETAGALLAAGLGDVLERAKMYEIHPVHDFPDRWAERVRREQLRTTRRPYKAASKRSNAR